MQPPRRRDLGHRQAAGRLPRRAGGSDGAAVRPRVSNGGTQLTWRADIPPNAEVRSPRAVVLVEGDSDLVALQTLAERSGRNLAAEGIDVVAMGGITNTRSFALRYGPRGLGVPLLALYDAPEEAKLRTGLAQAGMYAALDPDGLIALGFSRCCVDLEDEVIRALGADAVEAVIEVAGEARSLRLLA